MNPIGTYTTLFRSNQIGPSQPEPRTTPLIFPLFNKKHNSIEIISCFGKVGPKRTNVVWCYSSKFNNWSLFLAWTQNVDNDNAGPFIAPAPRSASAGCLVNDRYYTFGGSAGISPLDGLWVLNLVEREWLRIRPSKTTDIWPRARCAHTMVYGAGSLYLFGGWNTATTLADLWEFNIKTQKWKCLLRDSISSPFKQSQRGIFPDPPTSSIFKRSSHSMVYVEKTHSLIIFGGWDGSHGQTGSGAKGPWKSLVLIDLSSLKVSYIHPNSRNMFHNFQESSGATTIPNNSSKNLSWPSARRSHTSCMVGPYTMMIHGGLDRRRNFLNDCWLYDIRTKLWSKTTFKNIDDKIMPDIAHHACSVYHPTKDSTQVFFFGGEGLQGRQIHLWSITFESFVGPDDPTYFTDLEQLALPGFPGDAFAMSSDYQHFVDDSSESDDDTSFNFNFNSNNTSVGSTQASRDGSDNTMGTIGSIASNTSSKPKPKQNLAGSVALHPSLLSVRTPSLFQWIQNPSSWDKLIYACGFPLHVAHVKLEKHQNTQILSSFGKFVYSGNLDKSYIDLAPPPKWQIDTLTVFWLTLSTCLSNAPTSYVISRLHAYLINSLWFRCRNVPYFDAPGTQTSDVTNQPNGLEMGLNQDENEEINPITLQGGFDGENGETHSTNINSLNQRGPTPSYISLEGPNSLSSTSPSSTLLSLSDPSPSAHHVPSISTESNSNHHKASSSGFHSLKSPRLGRALSRFSGKAFFNQGQGQGQSPDSNEPVVDPPGTDEAQQQSNSISRNIARNLRVAGAIADMDDVDIVYTSPVPSFLTSGSLFCAIEIVLEYGSNAEIDQFSKILADCHESIAQKSLWLPRLFKNYPNNKVSILLSHLPGHNSQASEEATSSDVTPSTSFEATTSSGNVLSVSIGLPAAAADRTSEIAPIDANSASDVPDFVFTEFPVPVNMVHSHYAMLVDPIIHSGLGAPDFNLIPGISMNLIDISLYSLLHPGSKTHNSSADQLARSIATNRPPMIDDSESNVFTDAEAPNLADPEIFTKFISGILPNMSTTINENETVLPSEDIDEDGDQSQISPGNNMLRYIQPNPENNLNGEMTNSVLDSPDSSISTNQNNLHRGHNMNGSGSATGDIGQFGHSSNGYEFYAEPEAVPHPNSRRPQPVVSQNSPMLSWLLDAVDHVPPSDQFHIAPSTFPQPFRVSKCLLAARSKFFYGLFSSKMMESTSKAFVIQHYHPSALLSFVHWVYTGFFSCSVPDSFLFAHASPFYFPNKSSLIRSFAKTMLFSPNNSLSDLFNLFKFISFASKGSPDIQPFLKFVLISIARTAAQQTYIPPHILRLLAIHSTELNSFVSTVGEPLRTQLIHERLDILTEYLQSSKEIY